MKKETIENFEKETGYSLSAAGYKMTVGPKNIKVDCSPVMYYKALSEYLEKQLIEHREELKLQKRFIRWYSGMEQHKIDKAFERFLKEIKL